MLVCCFFLFFFSSRRRHTRWTGDWSSRRVLFRSEVGVGARVAAGEGHEHDPGAAAQDGPDGAGGVLEERLPDRKSTRLNSSHPSISYAVFCLKKKKAEDALHL